MSIRKRTIAVVVLVLVILILDQALKIWIKTNLYYGEEFRILGLRWARIHFVENNGMAFGIDLGGDLGKLLLGVFRLIAIGFLMYIIAWLIKKHPKFSLILCFGSILAGAIGNIIDSTFYGMIFSESSYHSEGVATMFPPEGGYSSFMFGKVVDMFYFPLISTTWPEWVPYFGGKSFEFFRPVFNVADTAISTGVISILLFHREIFRQKELMGEQTSPSNQAESVEKV